MAANEQWIPIISEVLSWIKAMHGPTKRELRIKVSELEQKVQLLTDGNVTLANNIELITSEILKQLKAENHCTINADAIIVIGENTGNVDAKKLVMSNSAFSDKITSKTQLKASEGLSIFAGVEEEIAQMRAINP